MIEDNEETGRIIKVKLDDLVLDPNNYRFINDGAYVKIEDRNKFSDPIIQRRTQYILLGEKNENVLDLIKSIKANGLLEYDYIKVVPCNDKYLVTDGNRRIAVLMYFKQQYLEKAIDVGKLELKYLIEESLPVALHSEVNPVENLIMIGLQNVIRTKPWPAYNQAILLRTLQQSPHFLSPDSIIDELGISRHQFNRSIRTLALIDQFMEKHKSEFRAEMYNYFLDIVSNPDLRKWIQWDSNEYRAKNLENLERLFSYFIVRGEDIRDEDEISLENSFSGPLLKSSEDLRRLAKIIHDENLLQEFERTGIINPNIEKVGEEIARVIQTINESISFLEKNPKLLAENELWDLMRGKDRINLLVKDRKFYLPVLYRTDSNNSLYETKNPTFTEIRIKDYKKYKDFTIQNLNRINIFAGINNSGKTSLLEAVFLLTSQTQYKSLFEIILKRSKKIEVTTETVKLIIDSLPKTLDMGATFDNLHTSLKMTTQTEIESEELQSKKIEMFSSFGDHKQSSEVILSSNLSMDDKKIGKDKYLCRSVFSSPFSMSSYQLMKETHKMSQELKRDGVIFKEKIIKFIQDRVDSKIRNIEEYQQEFRVLHEVNDTMYLFEYGEGLQRIFYISLLFAYAENGIVCIDEFENAIYFGLLEKFTRLVQELAVEFNVQVFLTTHSKECVDAFILNDYKTGDISAYTLLPKKDGTVTSFYYSGNDLKGYIEDMNTDVRTFL